MDKEYIKLLCNNNATKKPIKIDANKIAVLRAGSAVNPLTLYNPISLDVKGNDIPIDHSDYRYIGGDSFETTLTFETKIVPDSATFSSMSAPIRIYEQDVDLAALPNPTTGWTENTTQADIDKIKKDGDGLTITKSTTTSGKAKALMVEGLFDALLSIFGSNSIMKNSIRSIEVTAHARGEGSNNGALGYGCYLKLANGDTGSWNFYSNVLNSGSSIAKMTYSPSNYVSNSISPNNKVNFLIHSQYASGLATDGVTQIASKVELDSISIKIVFSKAVDTVQSKQVYLPNKWSLLVRGFAPSFTQFASGTDKMALIMTKDINNQYRIKMDFDGKISFQKKYNNIWTSIGTPIGFLTNNFRTINMLISQDESGMKFRALRNNDTVATYSSSNNDLITGNVSFSPLAERADSFFELFHFMPYYVPTDASAELLLRGLEVPSTSNLVFNGDFQQGGTGWTTQSGTWSFSNATATLNGVGGIYQIIDVLPNSSYVINGQTTGVMRMQFYQDSTFLSANNFTDGQKLITPNNCNKIRLYLQSDVSGTYTFDNISLVYQRPNLPTPIVNKNLFLSGVFNLYNKATLDGNSITLTTTNTTSTEESTCDIPALPNNKYNLKTIITGLGGRVWIREYYNNIFLRSTAYTGNVDVDYIVGATTNKIQLRFDKSASNVGTFIWSNISLKIKM